MLDHPDFGGAEKTSRRVCDGPRTANIAGRTGPFAGYGAGTGLQTEAVPARWPGRVGAVGIALLVVLIGWPALVFIDFALGLLLAFAI